MAGKSSRVTSRFAPQKSIASGGTAASIVEAIQTALSTLWNDLTGIFLNKDLHTGEFSHRLSPASFYPLLAHAATPQQAERMFKEHLLNEE
jgi:hypothetical protein